MESEDHIEKISGIGLGVSLQLGFSSFVTSGNHCQAFYGGNYDKLK